MGAVDTSKRVILFTGSPGVGKTTLVKAGIPPMLSLGGVGFTTGEIREGDLLAVRPRDRRLWIERVVELGELLGVPATPGEVVACLEVVQKLAQDLLCFQEAVLESAIEGLHP